MLSSVAVESLKWFLEKIHEFLNLDRISDRKSS